MLGSIPCRDNPVMRTILRSVTCRFRLPLIACLLAISGVGTVASQQTVPDGTPNVTCFRDWGVAARHIRDANLLTPGAVRNQLGQDASVQLLKLKLCRDGANYHYQVTLLDEGGTVQSLSIDAQQQP